MAEPSHEELHARILGCAAIPQLEALGNEIKLLAAKMQSVHVDSLRKAYTDKLVALQTLQTASSLEEVADPRDDLSAEPEIITDQPHATSPGSSEATAAASPPPPPPPLTLAEIWSAHFDQPDPTAELKKKAFALQLREFPFRSIAWRLFLNALPADRATWSDAVAASRKKYADIVASIVLDPHQGSGDLSTNNPLSQDDNSPWQQYFKYSELRSTIQQDVSRTFPEIAWFQDPTVQQDLLDILFYYSATHPALGYRQGMHELLAPMLMLARTEAASVAENASATPEMKCMMDVAFVQHDTFALFSALMTHATDWFAHKPREVPPPAPPTQKQVSVAPFAEPPAPPEDSHSAIGQKLNNICGSLLPATDRDLAAQLKHLDIAPQIYGLRWIRLLFSREFPLCDALLVWDCLFASGPTLPLLDHFFVAMLRYIRGILLASDYSTCLQVLMRYPDDASATALIACALHVYNPDIFPPAPLPSPAIAARSAHEGPASPQHAAPAAASKSKPSQSGVRANVFGGMKALLGSKPKQPESRASRPVSAIMETSNHFGSDDPWRLKRENDLLKAEVERLQSTMLFYGDRLEQCLVDLEREVFHPEDELPNHDRVCRYFAMLKETKDVLKGNIKADLRTPLASDATRMPEVIDLSHVNLGPVMVGGTDEASAEHSAAHKPAAQSVSSPAPTPATASGASKTKSGADSKKGAPAGPPAETPLVDMSRNKGDGTDSLGRSPHGSVVQSL